MTLSTTFKKIVPFSEPWIQASEPSSRIVSVPLTDPPGNLRTVSHTPTILLRSWTCALGGSDWAVALLAMHTPKRLIVRLSRILEIGVFMPPPRLRPDSLSHVWG